MTNANQIRILYSEPFDGGSILTNYDVQMDDGLGGGFTTIAGGDLNNYLETFVLVSSTGVSQGGFSFNITRGLIYRF